jgi:hypothetical protein
VNFDAQVNGAYTREEATIYQFIVENMRGAWQELIRVLEWVERTQSDKQDPAEFLKLLP